MSFKLIAVVAAAALVACAVGAAAFPDIDYSLSDECKKEPGKGCCPAFRMLIELKSDGCSVHNFYDASIDKSKYAAMCDDGCGRKLSALATMFKDKKGEGCPWVERVLTPFPWMCESDANRVPCGYHYLEAEAIWGSDIVSVSDKRDFVASGAACNDCIQKGVQLLSENDYDFDGNTRSDKNPAHVLPVFGDLSFFTCLKMDNQFCLGNYFDAIAQYEDLQAAFDVALMNADEASVDFDAKDLCKKPCTKSLVSMALGDVIDVDDWLTTTDYTYFPHQALAYLDASCTRPLADNDGTCWDLYTSTVSPLERQVMPQRFASCMKLMQQTPECTDSCAGFLKDVVDALGCCARVPFEFHLADDILTSLITNGLTDTGLADNLPIFYDLADDVCGVEFPTSCRHGTDTFGASTRIDFLSWNAVSTLLDEQNISQLNLMFARDIGSYFSVAPAAITIVAHRQGPDDSVIVDWEFRGTDDTATANLRDGYNSIKDIGLHLPHVTMFAPVTIQNEGDDFYGTATCSAEIVPLHYLPSQDKTMTTDCKMLRAIVEGTDCDTPDYVDDYGNSFWQVALGRVENVEGCLQ